MFVPPILFMAGARMLQRYLQSTPSRGSSSPPDIHYTYFAVTLQNLSGFADENPDAVPYTRFAELLQEHGYGSAQASDCTAKGRAMERQYPGCVVLCGNVRRSA